MNSGDELKDAVEKYPRHSLVGQWLELCVLTAEGQSSIPGWGIKISQAMWYGQKTKMKASPKQMNNFETTTHV